MKYFRVIFTSDIGIKKERIKEFEEFVKCKNEEEIPSIIEKWYGPNGSRSMGKNNTIKTVEEI